MSWIGAIVGGILGIFAWVGLPAFFMWLFNLLDIGFAGGIIIFPLMLGGWLFIPIFAYLGYSRLDW